MQKRDFSQSPLKVFFSYYGPHKKLFTLDIIMALLGVAADLAFPWVTRQALHTLLPDKKFAAFFTVMAFLFAAYVLRSVTVYIVTVFGHELGVRVEADMRSDIFRHVQQLSFSFFDTHRTGKLMSRMTTDLFDITELAHHGPENVLQAGLTLAGAVIILMTVRWELALVLLIMLPALLAVVISLRMNLRKASTFVKQETAEINAAVEGGVSGARTVKAFANESVEMEKFRVSNERFKKSKRVYYRWFGLFNSATEFTVAAMQVVVFAVGGYYIMRGRMDLADLVAFSLYVSIFTTPIRKLIFFVEQFETGRAGFERFLEIMRTPAAVEDAPDAKELESVKGDVEYRDVGFHYDTGPAVLEHIDLHIAPGETLALVGPSGSGKTTLSQLLPRFYDVTDGAVLVDGQDIRSVTQASLRRHIGIIQQDVFLFADTVRENIRYGRPDATDEAETS